MPSMKVTLSSAMRARDVSRPHAEHEALAETSADQASPGHRLRAAGGTPEGRIAGAPDVLAAPGAPGVPAAPDAPAPDAPGAPGRRGGPRSRGGRTGREPGPQDAARQGSQPAGPDEGGAADRAGGPRGDPSGTADQGRGGSGTPSRGGRKKSRTRRGHGR